MCCSDRYYLLNRIEHIIPKRVSVFRDGGLSEKCLVACLKPALLYTIQKT